VIWSSSPAGSGTPSGIPATPPRVLELISPGGFEDLFRELGALGSEPDPATLEALGARYGVKGDFQGTAPILQRHGLRF
jgi:hypothetical protein